MKIFRRLMVLSLLMILPIQGLCATEVLMSQSPTLKQKLQEALIKKGANYKPRTRHLLSDGQPKYTNRLILEGSPYLLQHAHNPPDRPPDLRKNGGGRYL